MEGVSETNNSKYSDESGIVQSQPEETSDTPDTDLSKLIQSQPKGIDDAQDTVSSNTVLQSQFKALDESNQLPDSLPGIISPHTIYSYEQSDFIDPPQDQCISEEQRNGKEPAQPSRSKYILYCYWLANSFQKKCGKTMRF